jgi:hypothetical protein
LKYHRVAIFLAGILASQSSLSAETVVGNNKATNPPLVDASKTTCGIELMFKPVPFLPQKQHAYLIITRPDGTKTEVRGGPQYSVVDGGTGSSEQPPGNPFSCSTTHKIGVVVPYIGKHGLLGKDAGGNDLHSPDGNVLNSTQTAKIPASGARNSCALANCLIESVKASGASCQNYILGTAWHRNSNTIISTALGACAVADPKRADVAAPGWGEPWLRK